MIRLKSADEIGILREGGKKLAVILDQLGKEVKPGITTGYLEHLARELIREAGGEPAFLGYVSDFDSPPFPTALCTSVNDEVVHAPALPARTLKSGDIIGIDVGMEYPVKREANGRKIGMGLFTDMAATFPVGKVPARTRQLIKVTRKSLDSAIARIKPGNTIIDIGRAVQECAEANGFSIVRDLVGHGVGFAVHEDPQIPNYASEPGVFPKTVLKPGMVIAVEPMVNMGKSGIYVDEDGFTFRTADGQLSAHFEHTIAVTEKGNIVLTAL